MKKNTLKNNFWKNSAILLSIILLAMVASTVIDQNQPVVQAQANNSGSGQQLFCARDFSNFIINGLDFDGEGFTDYWRDILVIYNTNYCQYTDIDSMLDRIDKARKQIREAFYVCDNSTVTRVTAQYYQLSAELYYLRHFVDTKESPNPKASDAEKEQNVQLTPDVHTQFINMFVNKLKYFDTTTAEAVFLQIQQKYESKLTDYRNCEDPTLGMLIKKIDDLRHTIDTIQQLGQKFAEKTTARFNAMEKRIAANPGLLSAFSADGLGDFMGRVASVRVNSETPQQSTLWEQISNTAKVNAPVYQFPPGPVKAPTFNDIANDMSTIKKRDEQNDLDIQYVSEYDLKYRQVGGSGLDKLKDNLDSLIVTIDDSFAPIDAVEVCAANIVGKQCGG